MHVYIYIYKLTLISINVELNPLLQATSINFFSSVSSHSLNTCFLPDCFSATPSRFSEGQDLSEDSATPH